MDLSLGGICLDFILLFPEQIFFNVPGEEGEKNTNHQGVVDDSDARKGIRNEVEGVEQINQPQKPSHQGSSRPLSVAPGQKIMEHGGGGADEAGKVS